MNFPENMTALETLVWVREQQSILKTVEDSVKQQAREEFNQSESGQVAIGSSVVSVTVRKTWTYSKGIEDLRASLKSAEKQYQKDFSQSFESSISLVVKQSNGTPANRSKENGGK